MSNPMVSAARLDPNVGPRVDAAALATLYDRCLGAVDDQGRAPTASLRFAGWLAAWWRPNGPSEPIALPDAISADRRGVHLARWYAVSSGLRGYVPGARGCYVVPTGVDVPLD